MENSQKLLIAILFVTSPLSFASTESDAIRAKIKEHLIEVRNCYNQVLSTYPEIEGKIVVDWAVSDSGEVTNVSIDDSKTTLKNETVHSCIIDKFKTWKFPSAEKGKFVEISYPFVFSRTKATKKNIAGFTLLKIERGSIYETLGLKEGDVIKKINGTSVTNMEIAQSLFSTIKKSDRVEIILERNGKKEVLQYSVK